MKENLEILKEKQMLASVMIDATHNANALLLVELGDGRELTALEKRIEYLEDTILLRTLDALRESDLESVEASKFLDAVTELQLVERDLRACQFNKEGQHGKALLVRVDSIIHSAMIKLEEDLVDLLMRHSQPVESNISSFRSENGFTDDFSINSINEELLQGRMQMSESHDIEEYLKDLVNPNVVPDIKRVTRLMFTSNYVGECCQSYITARKDALDEYLSRVFMEMISIEDVVTMEWKILDRKIARWIKVMKNFVRVYLPSEKHLCGLILGDLSPSASRECFFESIKDSIMQLLSFAEAIALLDPSEEKVFRILDVYETLFDLLPEIEVLDLEDSGLCIMTECQEILSRLSDCAKAIFPMLKDKIQNESSVQPPKGGYHPICRFVMNYLQFLSSYRKPISLVFGCSDSTDALVTTDVDETSHGGTFSIREYFISVVSVLESNLETKSWLYHNDALRHLFMMNNISYVVRKVRENSDLTRLFGEVWLKTQIRKYRSWSNYYQSKTWRPILSILMDEGISKHIFGAKKIKDKLKDFNHAFEEVYRVQTGWQIPDQRLRDDLRISISDKVVPVYRTFMGRHGSILDGKHVKHSPEDLHDYLFDLFEGLPKSLPNH